MGQQPPNANWGDWNSFAFAVGRLLSKVETAMPVQVVACTKSGAVDGIGFVDVVPLVNMIDGAGVAVPYTTLFNLPYARMQAGTNAIIMDPQPGDKGVCIFASRDITKFKNTGEAANPGSYRQFNLADGMYLGLGLLGATPTQYVQFSGAGIVIKSPTLVKLEAPQVTIQGPLAVNGNLTLTGNLAQTGTITLTGSMTASGTIHASNIP